MLDQSKEDLNEAQNPTDPKQDVAAEKAVESVENELAKSAEKSDEVQVEKIDYSNFSTEELVTKLDELIKKEPIQNIKDSVDSIKSVFNAKFSKILADKKAAFLAGGGNSIDFQFSSPEKIKFNQLMKTYRDKRDKYYNDLEKQLTQNLNIRLQVIEALKELIEKADPKTMYQEFQELKKRWNSIGPVPRNKYNDTWRNYHHHVERFYDLLHMSNDYRDIEFKHNLEGKMDLIQRVEALVQEADVVKAFKELQELHRSWKEDFGPVDRSLREEVWGRFSAATKKIHERRDEYYSKLKDSYEENVSKKKAIIDKIKKYDFKNFHSHADWQKGIADFESLREEFFKAGKVPRNKSNEIWAEFKEATRGFNQEKNKFYKSIKKEQQDNLKRKTELVDIAKSLKDSDDFDSSTETMKRIQAEWKRIGHVPRKFSDKIWKEFKAACNHYFDRLHSFQDERDAEGNEVYNQKKALLDSFKAEIDSAENLSVDYIKDLAEKWNALGNVPGNKRHIEGKFDKALEKAFGVVGVPADQAAMFRFKQMVDGWLAQNNSRKIDNEMLSVRKKIDELNHEAKQLENNLSFISNAEDDNPLVVNVRKNIEETEESMRIWKMKLNYLNQVK